MQGHTDIPLNEEGRQQATELQNFFKENPVDLFLSSDLQRAQQTAQIANAPFLRPFHTSPGLREAYLGQLEGLTLTEVHEKFGIEAWEKWISMEPRHFDFAYPEGETTHAAIARFTEALQKFCRETHFDRAGVCTHGLIMRRFLHSLRPDLMEALPIPNCVVYTIQWDEKNHTFSFSL